MDAQEQPALPTWLESLRANERPRTPSSGESLSTADLFDEDDLPGWMRPEHAEMAENVNGGQYGAPRPSSMPAPNTDAGMPPPRGFSASSLVDAASLPSWVQENQPAAQGPGSGSYFPGEAQAPPGSHRSNRLCRTGPEAHPPPLMLHSRRSRGALTRRYRHA
ncbi:MAG: hypothetical protein E6I93_17010 [Chloroflexi bacterium]|nr:MAG: hypothetical protein E6I93_17010 [Chloroflexota bacterium]